MSDPTDSELGRLAAIEDRMERQTARMYQFSGELKATRDEVKAISDKLDSNTVATLEGNRDAREILEIFQAVRGGLKVLGWLGTAFKWLAGIAAAAGGLWTLWNQIHKP